MLAAALTMLLAVPAVEDRPGLTMAWDAPAACGDDTATHAMVERLIGAPRPDLTAEVAVTVLADGDAWVANVSIRHDGVLSQRTLRGAPCSAVGDAVALVVAVTIDPLGASATVTRAIGTEEPPAEPLSVPPAAGPPLAPSPEARGRPVVSIALGPADRAAPSRPRPPLYATAFAWGGGAIGLLPQFGGQLGGGAALGVGAARVELAAAHRFATAITHAADASAGASVSLTTGRASVCWAVRRRRFLVPVCGGVEVGAWSARPFGLSTRATPSSLWFAAVPHVRPMLRATRWLAVGLDFQAPIALVRPRFAIDDFADDLVRIGSAGVRLGLAVAFTFFDEDRGDRASR